MTSLCFFCVPEPLGVALLFCFSCFDQGQVGTNAEEQIRHVSTSISKWSGRGLLGKGVPTFSIFFFCPNSVPAGLAQSLLKSTNRNSFCSGCQSSCHLCMRPASGSAVLSLLLAWTRSSFCQGVLLSHAPDEWLAPWFQLWCCALLHIFSPTYPLFLMFKKANWFFIPNHLCNSFFRFALC